MRVTGTGSDGREWYVESQDDEPFNVKVCKRCGYPVVVVKANPGPEVKVLRFIIDSQGDHAGGSPFKIGEVHPDVIRDFLRRLGEVCFFCGELNRFEN